MNDRLIDFNDMSMHYFFPKNKWIVFFVYIHMF